MHNYLLLVFVQLCEINFIYSALSQICIHLFSFRIVVVILYLLVETYI